jgi:hypothetical protein
MTAILDGILGGCLLYTSRSTCRPVSHVGYWRAFNLGILHRDVSDGNVMMLSNKQAFSRREWKESRVRLRKSETKGDWLADSERRLRKALRKLDRDPKGMLCDFDLYALHSAGHATPIKPSRSAQGASAENARTSHTASRSHAGRCDQDSSPERCETNSRRVVCVSSVAPPTNANSHSSKATSCMEYIIEDEDRIVTDFRVVSTQSILLRRSLKESI